MMSRRAAGLAGALLAALAIAGCAGLLRSYDVAPSGLSRSDDGLRRLLTRGLADTALARIAPDRDAAPGDALLRVLYLGALTHYAARYADSNEHLERASALAEDRVTTSVARTVLSVLANDRVLPYEPSRTERLLIPYYGALNRLRLGDLDGAVVEARRLAHLLERYDTADDTSEAALHAALRELTGSIFEAAGERNDADVAYRNARALGREVAPSEAGDGEGSLVIVIEQGFVAYRVESSLNVMLHPDELEIFDRGAASEKVALAGLVAARVIAYADLMQRSRLRYGQPAGNARALVVPLPPEPAMSWRCQGAACADSAPPRFTRPHLLRLAWPSFLADARVPSAARLLLPAAPPAAHLAGAAARASARGNGPDDDAIDVEPGTAALRFADVSAAIVADFERERATIMARTIARGAIKFALTQGAERRAAEKDETAGRIVGLLGNAGGAILEQADTRSWHLLPGGIALLRVTLPAGTHAVAVAVDAGGRATRRIELGDATVHAGRTTFLSARAW